MRNEKIKKTSFILLLIFFLTLPAFTIETGEIQGKVVDETGEGLEGVEIIATSPSLQGQRVTFSSKNGDFYFPLLPVGSYSISFKAEGFASHVEEEVIIRLGKVTHLKVTMKLSAIKEEIEVVAESPLIDKTSIDTSFHMTSADLERLPSQTRTVVDLVKFAPGVTGVRMNTRYGIATEGQPSFRGEGEEGNNWIIDGLTVSGVRLRNSGMKINFDAIEEIQIISDPFSPEFGSAYGGIINMVTRGGSNEWKGEFSLIFQDKRLQASRQEQLSVVSEPEYFSSSDFYFNLGGPLLKDKLWAFISNNLYTDREETRESTFDYLFVPGGEKTTRSDNFFAKISYALNNHHNLSLTSMFHKSFGHKGGTGIPDLYEKKNFLDIVTRINYKGIIDSSTFIEAGLGHVSRDSLLEPLDKDLGPAQYYIEDLARNIHNSYGNVTDKQNRLDFSFKFTKHVETENLGRHEYNLGFEYYSVSSEFRVDFAGKDEDIFPANGFDAGTKYYFDTWKEGRGTPTFFYEYGVLNFINSSRGIGIYFKDKISWGRFTLMAGFRSQTQLCLDDKKEKLWSWNLTDFFSPRLSLTFDLTGNGKNVLKLGWGRFSDLITTMPLGLFNSGAGLTFRTYTWKGPANPTQTEIHDPSNWQFKNEQKAQAFEVAEGLKPNFLTRYLVEFDKQIAKDWVIKARYVGARARRLLEVLFIFDPHTLYKFLYDNFEHKRRDYHGFEMELNGRVGEKLYLNASYSYSSAKGTNPGQTETGSWSQEEGSTNYIGLFGNHIKVPDLPELKNLKEIIDRELGGLGGRGIGDEGWYGKLPYSIDHNLKLNSTYLAPYGFIFSSAFEWISGYYWEKLGYVPFFGGYYSFPEGRGSRKTPAHFYLDLGLEKELFLRALGLPEAMKLCLRIDIFNFLNSQKPISFVKEDIPIFGAIWGRQQPRQARLMFKLRW